MTLENAGDARSGPGPWFTAGLDGGCSRCGGPIEPGDTIRADGWGSWECCQEEDEDVLAAQADERAAAAEAEAADAAAMEYDAMRHGGIL